MDWTKTNISATIDFDAAGRIYYVTEPERVPSTFHFVEDGISRKKPFRGHVLLPSTDRC